MLDINGNSDGKKTPVTFISENGLNVVVEPIFWYKPSSFWR